MSGKKNSMGLGRMIVLLISIIVFLGAAAVLLDYLLTGVKAQNAFKELGGNTYAELWEENNDIVGWITVDGTNIDYPVMQTKDDPEYYLRRDFEREYSVSGTPFMDADSDMETPSSNWLIYGHNIKSGIMFHDLLKYKDEDFYNEHSTFTFVTIKDGGESEENTYEVIAAAYSEIYPTDSTEFKYYKYASITSEVVFTNTLEASRTYRSTTREFP